MSFRARLTLAAAVAVALAVVVASALVYIVVRGQLRGSVDNGLRDRAEEIARLDIGRVYYAPGPDFGGASGYVEIVRGDGVCSGPQAAPCRVRLSSKATDVARTGSGAYFTDATASSAHLRIFVFPHTRNSSADQSYAVAVARPLDEVDHTLKRVKLFLVLIATSGIAIAGALGMLVSGAALAPVRRLMQATEHVARTQDLAERIEVHGDDELSRLAASFNTMLEALDRSQQAQQRLIADASHELRTPLTSLRTNIEVLALDLSMPEADRKQLLADVVEQLGEMTALVSELVELARGERHEAPAEEMRLDLVVDEAVTRARRNRPGITFESDLHEATIHGVPGSVERAVVNLLDNAAKWSPEGGTVEVAVEGPEVVVRDHGPGIDAQDLPHVFDRFYRAANARGRPGSGLGLAIVRQVAETHGGSVVAEQPADGGTRMRLTLGSNGSR